MEKLTFLTLRIAKENEKGPKFMEAALAGIAEIFKGQPVRLSLEMVVEENFLRFVLVVPQAISHLVQGQLAGQYQGLEAEASQDYIKQASEERFLGTEIVLAKKDVLPIQTYPHLEVDPLSQFGGVFSGLAKNERVGIQVVCQPINKDRLSFKTSKFIKRSVRRRLRPRSSEYFQAAEEAEVGKVAKPLFKTKIRLIAFAPDESRARWQLQALAASFKHFSKPNFNGFKSKKIEGGTAFLSAYQQRLLEKKTYLLNTEELASVYHLPYHGVGVSRVIRTKAKRSEPPENLPRKGTVEEKEISLFGETTFRNERIQFGIKRGDRSRHLYTIGKTGMGKTKMLELLILEDFKNGKGVAVMDPHGDLAEELLKYVPHNRLYDTIYFNPADMDYPIGFNPMESVESFEYKQNVVAGFIGIFKKLFAWNWNERLEHVLRYTTLALLDYPDSTVLGIPRMLTDNLFRQEVISRIQNPLVKKFWTTEFSSWSGQFSNEAIVPVINKVGQFVASPMISNIVGQPKSVMNLAEIMNDEKILICNLSTGKLGEENSALLGSMLITKIWQAALERAAIPERDRKDFCLYVDEFQNFATSAFANILSEARKFRLCLTVAHQYMKQLPEEVQATIFGNVGSIASFRVGGEDAAILEKEFTPEFSAKDLMNLDMREIYLKMAIDGQTALPFSARTINLPKVDENYSQEVIAYSRRKWARPRTEVEGEIEKFTQTEFQGKPESSPLAQSEEESGFSEPIV